MEITLEECLENGKAFSIKNKNYFETRAYVEPFIERMSDYTTNFRVQVKLPDTMTKTDNILDQGFVRVWVQALLPPDENVFDNHIETMNLLYALDTRKPLCKIFRANENQACLNMCTFNPHAIQVQELEDSTPINYRFVREVMEMADNTKQILTTLKNTEFDKTNIFDTLGHWVDKTINQKWDTGYGKVKISESTPIEVYKSLFIDQNSSYYCPEGEPISMFKILNAWTDPISNDKGKDLVNKFEKINLINRILNI